MSSDPARKRGRARLGVSGHQSLTSIRTRLTLSHLTVLAFAMGLSGLVLLSSVSEYFSQAMEDSLIAQAQITVQTLLPSTTTLGPSSQSQLSVANTLRQQQTGNIVLQTSNAATPGNILPRAEVDLGYLANSSLVLSAQLDTHIRILGADGVVVVDSAGGAPGQSLTTDALVSQALAGRYASATDPPRRGQVAEMRVAAPMIADGRLVGVVYVSQPMRDVTAVLVGLRNRWLLSTFIAVVLSGVVGLALSQAIARPLRRLTAAAEAVAQGQLAQEVPVLSDDEVGRLSGAFNEMTTQLRAAHQMQLGLVADVSLELRTPLTSVKGLVETLRDGAVEDYQVRDRFLETIETETDRLIRLVNDLLLLSRVDSGALNLNREALDLARLAESAVDQVRALAQDRQLTFEVTVSDQEAMAWIDRDRITQVLLNLLDNAIKYSGLGGSIIVSVGSSPEGLVQVKVQDQGIGIPADAIAHVGERFFRVDRARSRAQGGSGLGLAIARAIVQAHGGKLWLESREGQGTTAIFTLHAA
jgi:signal transduction histidine kinase